MRGILVVQAVAGEEGDGGWFAAAAVGGGGVVGEDCDWGGGKAPWGLGGGDGGEGGEGRGGEGAETGAAYYCDGDWVWWVGVRRGKREMMGGGGAGLVPGQVVGRVVILEGLG